MNYSTLFKIKQLLSENLLQLYIENKLSQNVFKIESKKKGRNEKKKKNNGIIT